MDNLIKELGRIQEINNQSALYMKLIIISFEEWSDLVKRVESLGYILYYDATEDKFVVSNPFI